VAEEPTQLDRMVAEQRLNQAMMRLGLSFSECVGLIEFDPEAETAYWRYEPQTGRESIHVGPAVAALDVECVEMVLRHEILHRSTFHGFGEQYADPQLSNLTLDVCINRLLAEAYDRPMRRLSEAIYPDESKTTAVALADCTADPGRLDTPLDELWRHAWDRSPHGEYSPLNPASLYFRLFRARSVIQLPPEYGRRYQGYDEETPGPGEGLADPRLGRAVDQVFEGLGQHLPRGSSLGGELSSYSVSPVRIGTARVEQFLRSIRLRRIADRTANKVTEPLQRGTRVQPYPLFPTRMGLLYQVCELDQVLGMYWNREVFNSGARMALGMYVDVSGSMAGHFPVVAYFVGAMKEYPLRVRVFDTEVREVDLDALSSGKLEGGGGTDFDAPIQDFLDDPELVAGVLFTDGEAQVSPSVGKRLRASRKRLYVVYLLGEYSSVTASSLDGYATESIEVHVD
jgi:hypothetical protein